MGRGGKVLGWALGIVVVVAAAAAGSVAAAEPAAGSVAAAAAEPASGSAAESAAGSAAGPTSVAGSAAGSASVVVLGGVLVAPVQGSESLRAEWQARVGDAVSRAFRARGYSVVVSSEALGLAVVGCQSPECVEQALDAAGVELAIVPAVWAQADGATELTLTLVRRLGRNLNASAPVGENLSTTAAFLVDALLAERAASAPAAAQRPAATPAPEPKHPHAWKAGPIFLLVGGTAAFVAIGVGAATRSDAEQLNTAAVAGWCAVGAAALAGGVSWWVVGAKRRRAPAVSLHPTRIDLRLQF